MYKGPGQTREFLAAFRPPDGVEAVICPPFGSLGAAVASGRTIFAQNVHWEDEGAFTGEVSTRILLELGVQGAIVGHSERRQYFGETDETVRLRTEHALGAGLRVIACVGELDDERERGETADVLRRQVSVLPEHDALVVAYEPVWAIGTGKTATPGTGPGGARADQEPPRRPCPLRRLGQARERRRAPRAAGRGRRTGRRRLARRGIVHRDLPGSPSGSK